MNLLFHSDRSSLIFAGFFDWLLGRGSSSDSLEKSGTAGRNGRCNALNQSFAAVIPREPVIDSESQEIVSGRAIALTTELQPTVLLYLPDLSDISALPGVDRVRDAEFMLQLLKSEEGKEIDFLNLTDEKEVDFPNTPIRVSIPEHGGLADISFKDLRLTLEPGQFYHWYFSILCGSERPARNPSVNAWIKVLDTPERIEIKNELSRTLNVQARAEFYLEKEFWSEAFSTLMQLRCQDPENVYYREKLNDLLPELLLDKFVEREVGQKISEAIETQSCSILLKI